MVGLEALHAALKPSKHDDIAGRIAGLYLHGYTGTCETHGPRSGEDIDATIRPWW